MKNKLPVKYSFNDWNNRMKTTDIKETQFGFKVKRFSNYVATESIRIFVLPNGFMYAKGVYRANYRPNVNFTEYFDNNGNEIKVKKYQERSIRLERKEWLEMQKPLTN